MQHNYKINLNNKKMETKLTEQESLQIISQMIEQTRNNLQKGSGNGFIIAGISVAFTAILNVMLAFIFNEKGISANLSFWVWCLMLPVSCIILLIRKKEERKSIVKTHIDSIIHSTWNGYLYAILAFLAVIFSIGQGQKFYGVFYLINPFVLILVGQAEYVTAKACRFKPFLFGAVSMWLGALACAGAMWFKESILIQFVILAVCMITGFVIPGYQLNKLAKKDHV